MNKKLVVIFLSVIIISVIFMVVFLVQNNQWEKDIVISGGDWVANGFENGFGVEGKTMFDVVKKGNPYYKYQISNETNRYMEDVVIVFQCEKRNKKWKYEFEVGDLKSHQEKDIRVYYWDMYENDDSFGFEKNYIKKITYKKR